VALATLPHIGTWNLELGVVVVVVVVVAAIVVAAVAAVCVAQWLSG